VASNQGSAVAAVVELAPGAKLTARVQSVLEDCVIVDLGARASGAIPTRQFAEGKLPEPGTNLEVIVAHIDPNDGLIHCGLAKAVVTRPAGDWSAVAEGQIVDCMVTKTNKGGLEVSVSNLRGFLPAGQVDLVFCSNLEQFVGQKLRVKILEVNPQKRNLVVSRRQYLEAAVAEAREEAWKHLQPGQRLTGKVKTIKDYGAFIDIGGVDGLLHVSEISWGRVVHPRDVLAEGQEVEVQILSLDRQKQKISLGMKQLQASPWQQVAEKFPVGAVVRGKVTKTTDFGAFVELEPGLEGMVHISELDHRRVGRVTDVLKVGQEVDVKVLSLDLDKKRIALSVKALLARPEAAKKPGDEELAPGAGAVYERKRKEPLKGGGTGSGGFLFGNPKDR
jgi:small subunit ribosomal protein S1